MGDGWGARACPNILLTAAGRFARQSTMAEKNDAQDPEVEKLRSFVTYRLARVQAKLNAQAMQILRARSELTLVEWRVTQLLRLLKTASMSQLARELQIDKGQLSRRIKSMVENGVVISEPDETDTRQQNLRLSAHGLAVNTEIFPTMQKRQALLMDGISDEDIATFLDVLEKIETATENRNP